MSLDFLVIKIFVRNFHLRITVMILFEKKKPRTTLTKITPRTLIIKLKLSLTLKFRLLDRLKSKSPIALAYASNDK